MTNPALGVKRNCLQCNAHFYDLKKSPATCPKCKHQFDAALSVRTKKKSAKHPSTEDDKQQKKQLLAKKQEAQRKKKSLEDKNTASHDIEEMDDMDNIDDVDEINALEEVEDEQLSEDDADDESIIEEMGVGEKSLVDNIEEEEAQVLVDEIEDERSETKKVSTNKKQ